MKFSKMITGTALVLAAAMMLAEAGNTYNGNNNGYNNGYNSGYNNAEADSSHETYSSGNNNYNNNNNYNAASNYEAPNNNYQHHQEQSNNNYNSDSHQAAYHCTGYNCNNNQHAASNNQYGNNNNNQYGNSNNNQYANNNNQYGNNQYAGNQHDNGCRGYACTKNSQPNSNYGPYHSYPVKAVIYGGKGLYNYRGYNRHTPTRAYSTCNGYNCQKSSNYSMRPVNALVLAPAGYNRSHRYNNGAPRYATRGHRAGRYNNQKRGHYRQAGNSYRHAQHSPRPYGGHHQQQQHHQYQQQTRGGYRGSSAGGY